MELNLTSIIVALVGGGTIGVIFKAVYDRICKKNDDRDEIKRDIKYLMQKSAERDIYVSQLKILNLIQHCPKDHKAIMMECEYYFRVLKADSWVFDMVSDWAKDEDVDIEYLKVIHDNNLKESNNAQNSI